MAKPSTWGMGMLCWGLSACGNASVRELETPHGKAMEVRCHDAKYCRQRTRQLSCQRGVKQVHALTDTHLVVSCSRRAAPERMNAASARGELPPLVHDDALGDRGASEPRSIRPNATMLSAAQRTAASEQQAETELLEVRVDLSAKCQAGSLNDCLAELDLTQWSALPSWGETPARDHRILRDRVHALLALCKRRHAPACHRLGELAHVLSGGSALFELSASGGLQATLQDALARDPKYQLWRVQLSTAVVENLQQHRGPTRNTVRDWSLACQKGSPGACLLGATVGWSDSSEFDDEVQRDVVAPALRVAERPAADALATYCSSHPSVCAEGHSRRYAAGVIDRPAYCAELAALCAASNAQSCERFASAMAGSICETDQFVESLYHKACLLGSARACGAMVQPSLERGTPLLGLAYSLQACQKQYDAGCHELSERFGRSREFTDEDTGLGLLTHACAVGHASACHDVYVAEYAAGRTHEARQQLFGLCVNAEHVRACRTAAQIDWLTGRPERAASLLERQCFGSAEDQFSCVELGALLAHQGQRSRALQILTRECQRQDSDHVCQLAKRIETGVVPYQLGEIFMEPLDWNKNTLGR